jgi:hypothetical protein
LAGGTNTCKLVKYSYQFLFVAVQQPSTMAHLSDYELQTAGSYSRDHNGQRGYGKGAEGLQIDVTSRFKVTRPPS